MRLVKESPEGKYVLETGMRACYNPTRMGKIALAAEDLVQRLRLSALYVIFPDSGQQNIEKVCHADCVSSESLGFKPYLSMSEL